MIMHAQNKLLACIVLVLFSSSQGFETREIPLFLNSDGSLTTPADTPNCGKDRKIDLIEYSYQFCHSARGCYTESEGQLSAAAELLLHDMCSWKEKCSDLSFPLRSAEQINRTNAVALRYSCIGQENTFVNICENGVTETSNTIYLTSHNDARLYNQCECFINKGPFSMTIDDLRLWRKKEALCSSASLLINSRSITCDEKKEGLDFIFHEKVFDTDDNTYVSLMFNSRMVNPDMVVLKISPKEKSRIVCESYPSSLLPVKEKDRWRTSKPVSTMMGSSAVISSSLQYTSESDLSTAKNKKEVMHTCSDAVPPLSYALAVLSTAFLITLILCNKRVRAWCISQWKRGPLHKCISDRKTKSSVNNANQPLHNARSHHSSMPELSQPLLDDSSVQRRNEHSGSENALTEASSRSRQYSEERKSLVTERQTPSNSNCQIEKVAETIPLPSLNTVETAV